MTVVHSFQDDVMIDKESPSVRLSFPSMQFVGARKISTHLVDSHPNDVLTLQHSVFFSGAASLMITPRTSPNPSS